MAEPSRNSDTPGPDSATGRRPGMPRWVKVFGIIALVAILALVILLVVGGNHRGPSRHFDGLSEPISPASVPDGNSHALLTSLHG